MPHRVRFVDKIDASPTVRLDLSDGSTWRLGDEVEFPTPSIKRSAANTMLRDGAKVLASAYENRTLQIPLVLRTASKDDMATELQKLNRELDRPQNILEFRPVGASKSVFFRTWRSPEYQHSGSLEGNTLQLTLGILAEPFAYGEMVENTGTIYNNPASGTNPISFQITGVTGDVPTPLFLHVDSMTQPGFVIGVRRHGTPAIYFRQCEDMTQGVDTTIQAYSAWMSGAGNNWSNTTFATATMQTRLTWIWCPGPGSSEDYRGTYRVFARVQPSIDPNNLWVRIRYGQVYNAKVRMGATNLPQLIDLGLIHVPASPDPVYDGYSGNVLPTETINLEIQAERTSDVSTLAWDYVVLVPADEEFIIASVNIDGTVFDGPNDLMYFGHLVSVWAWASTQARMVGAIPLVTPNQTNLYTVLQGTDWNTIADTLSYTARYWPRWLYVRP